MNVKFNKNKNYRCKCMVLSPNGLVPEGTVLSGKEWKNVLVFGVGNSFDEMFEVINDKTGKHPKGKV